MKTMSKITLTILLTVAAFVLTTSAFCGIKLEYKFNPGNVDNYKMSMGAGFDVNIPQKGNVSGEYNFSGKQEIKTIKIDENKNGVLEQSMSDPSLLLSMKTTDPNNPPQEFKFTVNDAGAKTFVNGVEQPSDPNMQKTMMSAFSQKTQVTIAPNGKFIGFQSLTPPESPTTQPSPAQTPPAQPAPSPTPTAQTPGTQTPAQQAPAQQPESSPLGPQQAMQEKLMKQLSDFLPSFPEGTIEVGHQWSNEIDIMQLLQAFGVVGDLGKIKIDSKLSSLDEKYGEKSANIVSTIIWNADNKSITSFFGILNIKKLTFTGTSLQNFGYEKGMALAVSFNANLDTDITLTPMGTQEPPKDLKLKLTLNFKQDLEKKQ